MTQEIGKVEAIEGSTLDLSQYPIGSFLRLVPYHVSLVVGHEKTVEMLVRIADMTPKEIPW